MRKRASWNTAAGLAVAALLIPAAGCTSGGDGKDKKDKAGTCTHGTYAWSGIERGQKLTALAAPIELKKKTNSVSVVLKPVGSVSYKPHMTSTAAGAHAAEAIKALGRHLGTEEPLADPATAAEPDDSHHRFEVTMGDLKGSYYAWSFIDLVEADFTYTCPGGAAKPVKGHVVTWDKNGSGFLSCGEPMSDEGPEKAGAAERAAARETCPAGSPAGETA